MTGLGAIGVVTAVGLAGTVAPAEAEADEHAHGDAPRGPLSGPPSNDLAAGRSAGQGVAPTQVPTEVGSNERTYTVRAGDTVSALALRFDTTIAAIVRENGLDSRAMIFIGQQLTIPDGSDGGAAAAADDRPAQPTEASGRRHTVRPGDTVSELAIRFDTSVAAIVSANDLGSRALIRIGQELIIPGSRGPQPAQETSQPSSRPPSSTTGEGASGSYSSYTVRSGDTLWDIAARHSTTVSKLTAVNDLSSSVIQPGQELRVPTQLVPSTFLHYTYPADVVSAANQNKQTLLEMDVPGRTQMQEIIRTTAVQMGVDPALALAVAHQESGFDAAAVSPANAVGAMQVIPSSGRWASDLVGRDLDLLDPRDNVVAGVAILRQLLRSAPDLKTAIAGYYQGLGSVTRNGMFSDTRRYVANVQTLMTRYA